MNRLNKRKPLIHRQDRTRPNLGNPTRSRGKRGMKAELGKFLRVREIKGGRRG